MGQAKTSAKTSANKAPAPPLPGVCEKDELFAHVDGQPVSGIVVCHGRHGATLKIAGKPRQVPWSDVLGHKQRAATGVRVVDAGDSGAIVEDARGRRTFVAGYGEPDPTADPAAKPMAKSLMPRALLFTEDGDSLLKAIKNGAGLSLQGTTDKAGHQTKRWKRTMPKEKPGERRHARQDGGGGGGPPRHEDAAGGGAGRFGAHNVGQGDQLAFKIGELEGRGTVMSAGKTGAMVADSTGHQHKVKWENVTGRGGEEKPAPHPDAAGIPDRAAAESDPDYHARIKAEMPAPKELPEDEARYFQVDGAITIPLDKLRTIKPGRSAEGASKFMAAAYHGKIDRRAPIKVTPNADGTYDVKDGNGTLAAATKHGWRALPAMVVQPVDTQEELFAKGAEGLEQLKDWLNKGKGVCSQLGYRTMTTSASKVSDAEWQKPGGMLFIASLKGAERAQEKVTADYGGDWSRLLDVVRCTIAVDSLDDLKGVSDRLQQAGMVMAKPEKDRFKKPTAEGYRDILMNVRLPNGIIAEVQLNVKGMLRAKNEGHKFYEASRSIQAKQGDTPPEEWSETDNTAYWAAVDQQKKIYSDAWAELSGGDVEKKDDTGDNAPVKGADRGK